MKKLTLTLIFLSIVMCANAQHFDKYFVNKTLRFDYFHAGNAETENYYFSKLIEEPHFGGSKNNLIDNNNFGNQMVKVYDIESNKLIFSKGFCTLFGEWRLTEQASSINKAYPESIVMPYPKSKVRVEIYSRNSDNIFIKKYEQEVDPNSFYIQKPKYDLRTFDVHYRGSHENRVDIVLLSEGYTEEEFEDFREDCEIFSKEFFKYSPFKENESRVNIRAVWKPSKDSGITIPGENIWKSSAIGASFYTLESERYDMVDNFQDVRDMAGNVPYDYIYILANSQKYGGGGIYNMYGISSASDPKTTGKVYVHEFGHLLMGLADEYVGGVTYSTMYKEGIEPWESNITRLVDFDKKSTWKSLIPKGTKIPTEVNEDNKNKVGVYEGGGYVAKGVYRPWINCMMNQITQTEIFCPVCVAEMDKMIDFVCGVTNKK